MYVIPLIAFVVLGLVAVAWNPIFALLAFGVFMLGFFVFVGMRPRADQRADTGPPAQPGQEERLGEEEHGGIWGEREA